MRWRMKGHLQLFSKIQHSALQRYQQMLDYFCNRLVKYNLSCQLTHTHASEMDEEA